MTRDSLLAELREIERELDGISPKASTYAKLKARARQVEEKLAASRA